MSRNKTNNQMKKLRLELNKTQEDIALESGITKISYQRYERGELEPKFTKAVRIAEALHTTPQAIWGSGCITNQKGIV